MPYMRRFARCLFRSLRKQPQLFLPPLRSMQPETTISPPQLHSHRHSAIDRWPIMRLPACAITVSRPHFRPSMGMTRLSNGIVSVHHHDDDRDRHDRDQDAE